MPPHVIFAQGTSASCLTVTSFSAAKYRRGHGPVYFGRSLFAHGEIPQSSLVGGDLENGLDVQLPSDVTTLEYIDKVIIFTLLVSNQTKWKVFLDLLYTLLLLNQT